LSIKFELKGVFCYFGNKKTPERDKFVKTLRRKIILSKMKINDSLMHSIMIWGGGVSICRKMIEIGIVGNI